MFKKILVLCAVVYSFAFSQTFDSTPLKFDTNLLAGGTMLQQNLQLFLPDTVSQILFNPSRANNYNGNFIYANYLPDSGKPFAFSTAALFGVGQHKWLLSINVKSSKYILDNTTNSDYVQFQQNYSNGLNVNTNSVSGKISFISTGIIGNYSLSAFINSANYNSTYDYYSLSKSFYTFGGPSDYHSQTNKSIEISNFNDKTEKINAGVEFAINNANWDYIGKLGYQFNNNIHQFDYNYNLTNIDSSSDSVHIFHREDKHLNKNSGSPYTIFLENFLSRKISLIFPSDYLFAALDFFVAKGSVTTQEFLDATNTKIDQIYRDDINDEGANLSLGYVMKGDLSDIHFISGLNLSGSYSNSKLINNVDHESPDYYHKTNTKDFSANLNLPIYVNYSPAEWVSVMGGFNVFYLYNNHKFEDSVTYVPTSTTQGYLSKKFYTWGTTNGSLTSQNFIGVELRHPSGLRAQISFKRSISETTYWNISLGYHF